MYDAWRTRIIIIFDFSPSKRRPLLLLYVAARCINLLHEQQSWMLIWLMTLFCLAAEVSNMREPTDQGFILYQHIFIIAVVAMQMNRFVCVTLHLGLFDHEIYSRICLFSLFFSPERTNEWTDGRGSFSLLFLAFLCFSQVSHVIQWFVNLFFPLLVQWLNVLRSNRFFSLSFASVPPPPPHDDDDIVMKRRRLYSVLYFE